MPVLTVLFMLGPVLAGLSGTLAPAFGLYGAIGQTEFGLSAFDELFAWPGIGPAVRLSLFTGLAATSLSLLIVAILLAGLHGTASFRTLQRLLSPLLSVPHAAAAFGLAFLIAPSGWVLRALSPWLTGWDRPPDLLILQDPAGLSLIAGLVLKEVPFLLLMSIAALGQVSARRTMTVAQSLGYSPQAAWLKTVFPRVYAQIRLPVFVVLAFSMSVVDVAMILGPNTPSSLSVQIVRWMSDADLTLRLRAAAGAVLQLGLVLIALSMWWSAERLVARLFDRWICRGGRGRGFRFLTPAARLLGFATAGVLLLGMAGLAVWSFAGFWSFPDAWPSATGLRNWMRHGPTLLGPASETALIAASATIIALLLTIGCLEAEHRYNLKLSARGLWVLYIPLLVPQVAFLPGLQTLMLQAGITSGRGAVIAAHVVFVLPYVFLSFGDPFRAWDQRYGTIAHALGAGADRMLWRVRLPMLLAPLLTAGAVGFAVSVGQYLPTLLIGGGRVQSLTTEAVALASGGDRRAIGVFALAQTAAALLPFAVALTLPRLIFSNRKGLLHD